MNTMREWMCTGQSKGGCFNVGVGPWGSWCAKHSLLSCWIQKRPGIPEMWRLSQGSWKKTRWVWNSSYLLTGHSNAYWLTISLGYQPVAEWIFFCQPWMLAPLHVFILPNQKYQAQSQQLLGWTRSSPQFLWGGEVVPVFSFSPFLLLPTSHLFSLESVSLLWGKWSKSYLSHTWGGVARKWGFDSSTLSLLRISAHR